MRVSLLVKPFRSLGLAGKLCGSMNRVDCSPGQFVRIQAVFKTIEEVRFIRAAVRAGLQLKDLKPALTEIWQPVYLPPQAKGVARPGSMGTATPEYISERLHVSMEVAWGGAVGSIWCHSPY
jgi:hypothetical protein